MSLLHNKSPGLSSFLGTIAKMAVSSGDSHSHILSVSSVPCPGTCVCPYLLLTTGTESQLSLQAPSPMGTFHPLPSINNPTASLQNPPCLLSFLHSMYYHLTYFKATSLRPTRLPELDVYCMRTQTSAGLFSEALWGLEWGHTVGVKSKPLQWVNWEQNWLQRNKSNFHFNIAGVWTSHITSHRWAM